MCSVPLVGSSHANLCFPLLLLSKQLKLFSHLKKIEICGQKRKKNDPCEGLV